MTAKISQRNALVEKHLWCIDSVIRQNCSLLKAAHLDRDDVYQSLALRLIRAVEQYDPHRKNGSSLVKYIFMCLRYEMRSCGSAQARYGLRGAPHDLPNVVVSLSALEESNPYWEAQIAA